MDCTWQILYVRKKNNQRIETIVATHAFILWAQRWFYQRLLCHSHNGKGSIILFAPDPDKQKVAAKVLFDNFKVPNIVAVGDETLFPQIFNQNGTIIPTLMVGKVSTQMLLVWL